MASKKAKRKNGANGWVKPKPGETGVDLAIRACATKDSPEGNQSEFARRMKVARALIVHWKNQGYVPGKRVLTAEEVTGVHRHYLNPELYPDPPAKAA